MSVVPAELLPDNFGNWLVLVEQRAFSAEDFS
ncbi:hypothetical protein JOF29_003283 [Kribbella aluminosa]|uniref:Uncharacterized protein n=1 Tax=Kribbella aluminosa TaxID=416017 RepID=A0ABS4UKQ3_9ACTN|nr:hypothetical protein [Kribbella aluminosa]